MHGLTLFTQKYQDFTYVTISTAPNCARPSRRAKVPVGMSNELTHKISILQAKDHFRDWHSLDDERVCAVCDRTFTGHEIVISTVGDEAELRCPTPDCQSRIHQWLHPNKTYLSDNNERNWWQTLGSDRGPAAGSKPSSQPV